MSLNKMVNRLILFLVFLSLGCQRLENKVVRMTNCLRIDFQEGDLPSMHPHDVMVYLRGISIGKTLFEGLTRVDQSGDVQLAGAGAVDISPDGLTYTFKLRKNQWSDGTLVKAQQYESAWKAALAPNSLCLRSDLLYMIQNAESVRRGNLPVERLGVKALDNETLQVTLSHPSPYFLRLLAQPIAAPLQNLERDKKIVFNGPFMVAKWERNSLLSLKPNPHFWNRKNVSLDQIDVYMVQDPETALALYEQKELDWVGVPLCPLSSEQARSLEKQGKLQSAPIARAFWVFLNTQHGILSSPSVRKALSCAIDRDVVTQNILIGNHPLEKSIPSALLPSGHNFSISKDIQEANRFLDLGLAELGSSREMLPPLVITYSQQANRKQFAEYLQNAWSRAFNIDVQLEQQDWNVLRTRLASGQFEISACYEAAFYQDPLELMDRFTSLNPNNFSQWVSPLYQEKISAAVNEADEEKRLHMLQEAEDILVDQMPLIPISSDQFLFAHHPKLKGYAFDSVGAIDFSYASLK